MGVERKEAKTVRIRPVDTSGLRQVGYQVYEESIFFSRDEKKELLGQELQVGKLVTIDYCFRRKDNSTHNASVVYEIFDIQPPNANQIGQRTIVKIEGEKTGNNQSTSSDEVDSREQEKLVRRALGQQLEFLMGEIELAQGLNLTKLEAQVESLEKQLLKSLF